jgi:hypothetical protein
MHSTGYRFLTFELLFAIAPLSRLRLEAKAKTSGIVLNPAD